MVLLLGIVLGGSVATVSSIDIMDHHRRRKGELLLIYIERGFGTSPPLTDTSPSALDTGQTPETDDIAVFPFFYAALAANHLPMPSPRPAV